MCVRARRSQCSSSESARSRWLDLYKQQNHTSGGIGDIVPFGVVIIFCFSSPARKTNSDSDEREHTTVLQWRNLRTICYWCYNTDDIFKTRLDKFGKIRMCFMISRATLLEPKTDMSVSMYWSTILISVIRAYEDAGIEAHMCLHASVNHIDLTCGIVVVFLCFGIRFHFQHSVAFLPLPFRRSAVVILRCSVKVSKFIPLQP